MEVFLILTSTAGKLSFGPGVFASLDLALEAISANEKGLPKAELLVNPDKRCQDRWLVKGATGDYLVIRFQNVPCSDYLVLLYHVERNILDLRRGFFTSKAEAYTSFLQEVGAHEENVPCSFERITQDPDQAVLFGLEVNNLSRGEFCLYPLYLNQRD